MQISSITFSVFWYSFVKVTFTKNNNETCFIRCRAAAPPLLHFIWVICSTHLPANRACKFYKLQSKKMSFIYLCILCSALVCLCVSRWVFVLERFLLAQLPFIHAYRNTHAHILAHICTYVSYLLYPHTDTQVDAINFISFLWNIRAIVAAVFDRWEWISG